MVFCDDQAGLGPPLLRSAGTGTQTEFRAILRAALCGRTPSPRCSAGIVERQENRDTFESTTTAIAKRLEEKHAADARHMVEKVVAMLVPAVDPEGEMSGSYHCA